MTKNPQRKEYGLGAGCYAEPRVGERIRSKHRDRNKLVKAEDGAKSQLFKGRLRKGECCSNRTLISTDLVRLPLFLVQKFYTPTKRMDFLIGCIKAVTQCPVVTEDSTCFLENTILALPIYAFFGHIYILRFTRLRDPEVSEFE